MSKNNDEIIYFVTGGGTGGHIYPAVSVISALKESGVDNKNIFYLGNNKNLEYEIAKKNGYNFLPYCAKGMPRKFNLEFICWGVKLFFATIKAIYYALKYKPDAVFATGGYVCAPILFACLFLNIPYVLHESDIQPGIVTRFFSKKAKSVSIAFEEAKKFINNKKVFLNGNPIRQEFKTLTKLQARKELSLKEEEFTILIMGGSLGARTINNSSFKILKEYAHKPNIRIIWQTGKKNFDDVIHKILDEFEELPDNLLLQPYYDKMYVALLASDIVVSRAGSLSLSEICASNVASILIPYPYASQNHQYKNAKYLVDLGCALMLEDKDCNNDTLFKMVDDLIKDKQKLSNLAYNAGRIAKTESAKNIVFQINEAIKQNNK